MTYRMIAYTEMLLASHCLSDEDYRRLIKINDYLCMRANRNG